MLHTGNRLGGCALKILLINTIGFRKLTIIVTIRVYLKFVILKELATEESRKILYHFYYDMRFFTSQHPNSLPSFRMTFSQQKLNCYQLFIK